MEKNQCTPLREDGSGLGHWVRFELLPPLQEALKIPDAERGPKPSSTMLFDLLEKVLTAGNPFIDRLMKDVVYVVLNHSLPLSPNGERNFVAGINWNNIPDRTKRVLPNPSQESSSPMVTGCDVYVLGTQSQESSDSVAIKKLWSQKWQEYLSVTKEARKSSRFTWNQLLLERNAKPLPVGLYWGKMTRRKIPCHPAYFRLTESVANNIKLECLSYPDYVNKLLELQIHNWDEFSDAAALRELDGLLDIFNKVAPHGAPDRNRQAIAWKIFHLVRSYALWGGQAFISIPVVMGTFGLSHAAVLSLCSKKPLSISDYRNWYLVADALLRPFVEMDTFGLIAVKARAEENEKFKQMMDLLMDPLQRLSGALSDMQRDTQALRAIIYEPEEALFASYQLIEPYFRSSNQIHLQMDGRLPLCIKHTPSQYDEEDLRIVIALVACAVFGEQEALTKQKDIDCLLAEARFTLEAASKRPSTKLLADDLKWLARVECVADLANWKTTQAALVTALGSIKDTLFTPFKVDSRSWPESALVLLCRQDQLKSAALIIDNLAIDIEQTPTTNPLKNAEVSFPCSYATMLTFIRDLASVAASSKIVIHEVAYDSSDGATICIKFSGTVVKNAVQLADAVVKVAGREWRVVGTNYGDTTRPFILFVNRLLCTGVEYEFTSDPDNGIIIEVKQNADTKLVLKLIAQPNAQILSIKA